MTAFRWDDPLSLDGQLSAEEILIRDTARRFARDELLPGIVQANRYETFDPEIMRRNLELGFGRASEISDQRPMFAASPR